jgi:hypothetical protein
MYETKSLRPSVEKFGMLRILAAGTGPPHSLSSTVTFAKLRKAEAQRPARMTGLTRAPCGVLRVRSTMAVPATGGA